MTSFQGTRAPDKIKIRTLTNIGEVVVGGVSTPDPILQRMYVILLALINTNDPFVNEALLAQDVKFLDRFTKTKIFPRVGMALPNGQTYTETEVEEIATLVEDTTENK